MDEGKLLPCPFCGGDEVTVTAGDDGRPARAVCGSCGASAVGADATKASARWAWNLRGGYSGARTCPICGATVGYWTGSRFQLARRCPRCGTRVLAPGREAPMPVTADKDAEAPKPAAGDAAPRRKAGALARLLGLGGRSR